MTSAVTGAAPAATHLRVGSFTPSVLLAIAERTGGLERAGLSVTETPVPSSPAQFASLRDGELDVALTSPDNVLAYRFTRRNPLGELLDARVVGAIDRGMGLALYARPGLGIAELRGARVGVDVPVSGFALAMYAVTESLGVPRDDYELLTLGSTPKRARALLAGECDFTMLNAGNELPAEAAGCTRLAGAAEVCAPYLGSVLAVVGETHQSDALRLAAALRSTAAEVLAGDLDDIATEAAADVLALDAELAHRYVARLRDADEGLTAGPVDRDALATLVGLRRRYLPADPDPYVEALDPSRGLVRDDSEG